MKKLAVVGLVCLLVACFVAPTLAGTTQGKHGQKWLHYEGNYCVWTWQMTLTNNDSWKKEVKMTISLWDANKRL